jgi:hypothetical protein
VGAKLAAVLLLLVAAISAGALAGCGGSDGGAGSTGGEPSSAERKAAAANFDGVHSGEIEVAFGANRYGEHAELFEIGVQGSFMGAGEEAIPQVALSFESSGVPGGRDTEFPTEPFMRADHWAVVFGGRIYEPERATFEKLKSQFEQAQHVKGGEGNAMACVEAAHGFDVTDIVGDVSSEGAAENPDGSSFVLVGADLDVAAAIDDLRGLMERSAGCRAQLEAVGVPPVPELDAVGRELQGNLAEARLTLGLDRRGVIRYCKALVEVELPHGEELELELVTRLNHVNAVSELPDARRDLPFATLLQKFGVTVQDVKQADAGEFYVGLLGALADVLFGREES